MMLPFLIMLLAIAFWPITLLLIVVHIAWVIIQDCGLRINFWFIKINIKPRDYQQEILDATRPLNDGERIIFERHCKRTGAEINNIRAFK